MRVWPRGTHRCVRQTRRPSRRGAHVGVPVQRKGHDLTEVGEKLKVKTVLEGSVRKAGNRLRINAQLINTEDGYHLWSERYDREMEDVFAVQDEIARTVVGKLQVTLLGELDAPRVTRQVDDLEAYNLCLEGRYHVENDRRGRHARSRVLHQRAGEGAGLRAGPCRDGSTVPHRPWRCRRQMPPSNPWAGAISAAGAPRTSGTVGVTRRS